MKVNDEVEKYVQERNEAVLSFDLDKIKSFFVKHKKLIGYTSLPKDEVLYASAMKMIPGLRKATREQKLKAQDWLLEHGYKPRIDWSDCR